MPRSKNPDDYPRAMLLAFQRAREGRSQIDCETKNEAKSMIHTLHSFRVAHERAGRGSLRDVIVRLEGTTIILEPNKAMQALMNATAPSEEESDDYLARAFANIKAESEASETETETPHAQDDTLANLGFFSPHTKKNT